MTPLLRLFTLMILLLAGWPAVSGAFQDNRQERALPVIAVSALPREARDTLALIKAGGPFKHAKDGTTFSNREGRLPKKPRGHYREYTVRTPGVKNRGTRRIVSGGGLHYYTDDHYETFKRIQE